MRWILQGPASPGPFRLALLAVIAGLLWAPVLVRAQEPEEAASPPAAQRQQGDPGEANAKDGKAEPSSSPDRFQVRPVVGDDRQYEVKEGESLYEVARHHSLAMEHVAWANDLPVDLAPLAEEEVVLPSRRILPANPPRDGVVVNLAERGLYLFQDGEFAGFYAVAIGKDGKYETPTGKYEILDKQVNPTWRVPKFAKDKYKDEEVKPGPDNPLGDRWIGITTDGLGFHSTNDPMYIGDAVSHGCMRLYPPEARDFYRRVDMGMPVRIEYETVKVGRSGDRYYLAVFPDVYHESKDQEADVRAALEAAGLEPLPRKELARRVETPTGVAEPLPPPPQVARSREESPERAARDNGGSGSGVAGSPDAANRTPEATPRPAEPSRETSAEPWWRSLLSRLGFLGGGSQAAADDR